MEDLPRALFSTLTYGFVSFNYSSSRVWTREDLLETILSSLRVEDCGWELHLPSQSSPSGEFRIVFV